MKCFLLHVYNILKTFHHALVEDMFHRRVPFTFLGFMLKQDPVSTTQKTGWTIHSSFPVLFGLEKGFILDVITRGGVNKHFPEDNLVSAGSQLYRSGQCPNGSLGAKISQV